MNYILIALISFFSGTIKGSSGFGSSLVAIPLLAFFYNIEDIVIIMITVNLLLNTIMVYEQRSFSLKELKKIKILIIFGVIFTFIGLQFLDNVNEQLVKYFVAILIFFAVLNKTSILNIKIKDNNLFKALSGAISGFSNGIASIDGPPIVFYLISTNKNKDSFKSTLVTYFLVLGLISTIILIINDQYSYTILKDIGFIAIFIVSGVFVGIKISTKIDEQKFQNYIVFLLIVLGFSMFI